MNVRKVFITDGPASGKTTLAQRITAALNAPAYNLDSVYLNMERTAPDDRIQALFKEEVARITATDAWVAEGAYLGLTEPLMRYAELVLWLDVPWRVASYRILSRHVKASIARNNRFPGWRRLYRFWRLSSKYYSNQNPPGLNRYGVPSTRATAIELLEPYKDKLVVCRTQKDVEALLARLTP